MYLTKLLYDKAISEGVQRRYREKAQEQQWEDQLVKTQMFRSLGRRELDEEDPWLNKLSYFKKPIHVDAGARDKNNKKKGRSTVLSFDDATERT
mmetsp:Transcript_36150/g.41702  ORF Transcript_36150/g.41702 Transcript_36150/m.41702 type:complete len:94 (-) Transcript_36150:239-520(-)